MTEAYGTLNTIEHRDDGSPRAQIDNMWFYAPSEVSNIPIGSSVRYIWEQKTSKTSGKPYKVCTRIGLANGQAQQQHFQGQQSPQGTAAPGTQPPPQQQPMPATSGVTQKDCQIFVTGFLQQCFQGTGQFPGREILAQLVADAKYAFETGMSGNVPRNIPTPQPGSEVPPNEIPW